jgi:flagella basal body P-ring formation protein FlgA
MKPAKKFGQNYQFPEKLLSNASAANNLKKGSLLSEQDLNIVQVALVAAVNIPKGDLLTSSNTSLRDFYGKLPSDTLTTSVDSLMIAARKTINTGQPIRLSDTKEGYLIKRGDSVTLTIKSGVLEIVSQMVAKDNGRLNEQITLINVESNEEVRGKVTGLGQASGI